MDLFAPDPAHNLLPGGGVVNYYGTILSHAEADRYFQILLETIPWKNDELVIFGKHITTARKVAWYGDRELPYTYSGTTKQTHRWTPELLELKATVGKITGVTYNSCLLNLYHNGGEGMSWHSDNEKTMVHHAPIASISLGAERKFSLKHRESRETISTMLGHGSLLVMKGATQENWLHSVPKATRVMEPRINLTFRNMREL